MPDRVVETEYDLKMLIECISEYPKPFVCSLTKGSKRSVEQNKLQRLWIKQIAEQMHDTPEEVRGFCKLVYGVPILRVESEAFRIKYDEILKPLGYEQKIALMMEPLNLPVTRIMTTKQKTNYLDAIYRNFTEAGLTLTQPDDMGLTA